LGGRGAGGEGGVSPARRKKKDFTQSRKDAKRAVLISWRLRLCVDRKALRAEEDRIDAERHSNCTALPLAMMTERLCVKPFFL